MKWELGALKILARNDTVPGIALRDAIEEIERLQKITESPIVQAMKSEPGIAMAYENREMFLWDKMWMIAEKDYGNTILETYSESEAIAALLGD